MPEQLDRIEKKLTELESEITAVYASAEKMRKYFLWTLIVTVGVVVIPLFILPFFLPAFFQSQGVGVSGL